MRRQEGDRVVAPVVAQAALDEVVVLDELVDRHQLDGRHAERAEVLDDGRVGERGVRAADVVGDVGMEHRQTPDVGLVDDRLVHLVTRRAVVGPVEERVADHRARHVRRAVGGVGLVRRVELVREAGLVPVDVAVDRLGVRVEQQLGGVAPQALLRVPRAVDPVAVALARADVGEVGVPAVAVDLAHLDAHLGQPLFGVLEQAQLDAFGDAAEQGEVGARPVVVRAEGIRAADPLAWARRFRRPGGPLARRHPGILSNKCGRRSAWRRRRAESVARL